MQTQPIASVFLPPSHIWAGEHTPAVCSRCDAQFLAPSVTESRLVAVCPICAQGSLEILDQLHTGKIGEFVPELAIPFALDIDAAGAALKRFIATVLYPPADMNFAALTSRLRRMYLPKWLVDYQVNAEWQVEAGFDYDVVSHQDQYSGGGWQSREVTERRVRWEPRLGRLNRGYTNTPGPAIDKTETLMESIGEFDPLKARLFDPSAATGVFVNLPNRSHQDAWTDISARAQAIASEEVRQAAGADHQRRFSWRPNFSGQNWTLLLQPVYSTFFTDDDGQPRPVWINAQTGKIGGLARASMPRALRSSAMYLAVAALAFIIGLALAAATAFAPPLLAVAILAWSAALIFGIFAVVPVIRVWMFNRSRS